MVYQPDPLSWDPDPQDYLVRIGSIFYSYDLTGDHEQLLRREDSVRDPGGVLWY